MATIAGGIITMIDLDDLIRACIQLNLNTIKSLSRILTQYLKREGEKTHGKN